MWLQHHEDRDNTAAIAQPFRGKTLIYPLRAFFAASKIRFPHNGTYIAGCEDRAIVAHIVSAARAGNCTTEQ
ncbi:hypothetical protein EQO05_10060 [Methanosarcina sp. MSH10X1]|uniref:hypothetical protein n=1 Tax=Methanosarcina sp. MSH10X1 TaxID=2507075 RepID=UPI000FFC9583|nr:hypothetical protein [Methanosarcina sp. MSH10X1]RXA18997.1 hypothetical protein EQO05_10060 [Methanosarcina sp. MSH10X1]